MKKIYNLIIIYSESKTITDKTYMYKVDLGYCSTIETTQNRIKLYMDSVNEDMEEFPEYIYNIYCDVYELDEEYYYDRIFFDNDAKLILFNDDKFNHEIGDFVSISDEGYPEKVGVITNKTIGPDLPYEYTYTIFLDSKNSYMNHLHLTGDNIYKYIPNQEKKNEFLQTFKDCTDPDIYTKWEQMQRQMQRLKKFENVVK